MDKKVVFNIIKWLIVGIIILCAIEAYRINLFLKRASKIVDDSNISVKEAIDRQIKAQQDSAKIDSLRFLRIDTAQH